MDIIKIISIILLFFLWAYILYRWIKAERELDKSEKEIQRYQEEELKKDENNLLNDLKLEGPIIKEFPIDKTKRKFGERHRVDADKWLDKQKENGSIPIKQSFVLKGKSGRYFQDIFEIQSEHVLLERVMETTDDILKAKKYRTHKEASEEAIKYDFKVITLNTYVKEL